MYLVFNGQGKLIGNCNQIPDETDLLERDEFYKEYDGDLDCQISFDLISNSLKIKPNPPDLYHVWNESIRLWETNSELQAQKQADEAAIKQAEIAALFTQAAQKIDEYQDLIDFAETSDELAAGEAGHSSWRQYRTALMKYQKGLILSLPTAPE